MGEMEEGAAGDSNQENTCRRLLKNRIEDATPVFKCTTLANVPLTKRVIDRVRPEVTMEEKSRAE